MTFAIDDRIISKRRPHEGVAIVTAVNEERRLLYYSLPNGDNPPITGHGPLDAFEHAPTNPEAPSISHGFYQDISPTWKALSWDEVQS